MAFLFLDRRNVAIGSVLLAVIFSLGVIIGYYSKQEPSISRDGRANEFVDTIVTDQFLKDIHPSTFFPWAQVTLKKWNMN